jgi:predicted amidohydrolase
VEKMIQGLDSDLLVLPELFTSGYFFKSQSDLAEVAEPVPDGPTTDILTTWAEDLKATVVAGLPEQEGEAFYNSAVIVSPEGEVTVYRKVHLFYQENDLFTPGNLGFQVLDMEAGDGTSYRLGVMVCFDWYFPEAARTLAVKGADVIAHPSNLVLPHCPESMPVRARENHVFTITANRIGSERREDETLQFIGLSETCDPNGTILQRAGKDDASVGTVEVDPATARDRHINRYNDVLADRRPEMYSLGRE